MIFLVRLSDDRGLDAEEVCDAICDALPEFGDDPQGVVVELAGGSDLEAACEYEINDALDEED